MFRERIQREYEALSPRFRSLADFILENTLDVGFLTATELARRVGVDPATVVRFSQELGYSGYRELSREIKRYINQQLALRFQTGSEAANGIENETTALIDALSDRILGMKADYGRIVDIAEIIHKSPRTIITGTADGYGIAQLWATYLSLLGLPVSAERADVVAATHLLHTLKSEDVVMAISLGLSSDADVGRLLHFARKSGCETISITTSPTLLPAREANINMVAPSKTMAGYPSFDTLMALLSLIWQAIINLDEASARSGISDSFTTISALMDQRDKIPSYESAALMRLWEQTRDTTP